MEKCLHPLIWGPQRAFPMSDPLTPVTSLTWACPRALAPFGPFQQDFSQLPLLSRGGTRLQPCPAQRQNSQFIVTKNCGVGVEGEGKANFREEVLSCGRMPGRILPIRLLYYRGNIFLVLGEAIFTMDNKSPEIMFLKFCEARGSHVYTKTHKFHL